jgi:hypothetical protein
VFETENSNAVDQKLEGAAGNNGVDDGLQCFGVGGLIT